MKYIQNLRGKNEQEVLTALGDAAFPLLIGGGDENEDVKVFIDDNKESLNNRISAATDIEEAFDITYKPYIINGYDQRISLTSALGYGVTNITVYTTGQLLPAPYYYNYSKVSPIIFNSSNTDVATIDNNGIITIIANGTSIISASFAGNERYKPHTAQYTLNVNIPPSVDPEPEYPLYNGHKYVDLGLTSGTMWATYNMGATAINEKGNDYWWGNITTNATPDQYASHYNGDEADQWSKYNDTDEKKILDLTDDAARVIWGGNWRVPTRADFNELLEETNISLVQNYLNRGTSGMLFTSKTNGNTLFFPINTELNLQYPRVELFTNELDIFYDPYRFIYAVGNGSGSITITPQLIEDYVTDELAYRSYSYGIRPVYNSN